MSNPFEHISSPSIQEHSNKQEENTAHSFANNLGQSFFYTLIESPLDSVIQLASHATDTKLQPLHVIETPEHARAYSSDWVAQQLGSGVATVGQFLATSYVLTKVGGARLLTEKEGMAGLARLSLPTQMGVGAAYAGLLTPVDENGDFVKQRINNAVAGALSFGAMERTNALFRLAGESSVPVLNTVMKNGLANSVLSGGVVGALNADIDSEVRTGHLSSGSQRLESALSFAMIGGAMTVGSRIGQLQDEHRADNFTFRTPSQTKLTGVELQKIALPSPGAQTIDISPLPKSNFPPFHQAESTGNIQLISASEAHPEQSVEMQPDKREPFDPAGLRDPQSLAALLRGAAQDFEHAPPAAPNQPTMKSPEWYAKYINDRIVAAGAPAIDVDSFEKMLKDTQKAYSDTVASTGEQQQKVSDWADFAAQHLIDQQLDPAQLKDPQKLADVLRQTAKQFDEWEKLPNAKNRMGSFLADTSQLTDEVSRITQSFWKRNDEIRWDWSEWYPKQINDRIRIGGYEPIDEKAWTQMLKNTKEAHSIFEKESGTTDEDWAGWYARRIVESQKFGISPADLSNPQALEAILKEARGEFAKSNSNIPENQYIAQRINQRLTASGHGSLDPAALERQLSNAEQARLQYPQQADGFREPEKDAWTAEHVAAAMSNKIEPADLSTIGKLSVQLEQAAAKLNLGAPDQWSNAAPEQIADYLNKKLTAGGFPSIDTTAFSRVLSNAALVQTDSYMSWERGIAGRVIEAQRHAIHPADLENTQALASALEKVGPYSKQMMANSNGSPTDWPAIYAYAINERLKLGGYDPINGADLARKLNLAAQSESVKHSSSWTDAMAKEMTRQASSTDSSTHPDWELTETGARNDAYITETFGNEVSNNAAALITRHVNRLELSQANNMLANLRPYLHDEWLSRIDPLIADITKKVDAGILSRDKAFPQVEAQTAANQLTELLGDDSSREVWQKDGRWQIQQLAEAPNHQLIKVQLGYSDQTDAATYQPDFLYRHTLKVMGSSLDTLVNGKYITYEDAITDLKKFLAQSQ